MAIDVNDLPPAYQTQVLCKLAERERGKQRAPTDGTSGNRRKYHNKPTERITASGAVLRFDSRKEACRYDTLAEWERQGIIRDLRMQVDFTLQEAYTDREGRRVRAIRYKADFVYLKQDMARSDLEWREGKRMWRQVVEDVKSRGTRTREYILKRKLMKERFNIDIQEV